MRSTRTIRIFVLALAPALALAQQSNRPTREDVLKFFTVMRVRESMEAVRTAAVDQARSSLRDMISEELPGATPQQIAELDGMVDKMVRAYTIDNTIEDLIPIYQKHLTKSDLDTAAEFFSSPVGKKFLDTEPVITSEAMEVVNAKTQQQMAASMAQIYKRLDEMKEQRTKAPAKPGTTKPRAKPPATSKPVTPKAAPSGPTT